MAGLEWTKGGTTQIEVQRSGRGEEGAASCCERSQRGAADVTEFIAMDLWVSKVGRFNMTVIVGGMAECEGAERWQPPFPCEGGGDSEGL